MTISDSGTLIGVLVIDSSDFNRACTIAGLETTPGLSVRGFAAVGANDVGRAPDLVLFQIGDPAALNDELKKQVMLATRRWPFAATLVVAEYADAKAMLEVIKAGADGLLTSAADMGSIRSAILLLVEGISVYPKALTRFLRHGLHVTEPSANGHVAAPLDAKRIHALTSRQLEVLNLLALGCPNKVIAQQLHISESTVKVHIRAIMAQNGTSNRTQIVAHFLKNGRTG